MTRIVDFLKNELAVLLLDQHHVPIINLNLF